MTTIEILLLVTSLLCVFFFYIIIGYMDKMKKLQDEMEGLASSVEAFIDCIKKVGD